MSLTAAAASALIVLAAGLFGTLLPWSLGTRGPSDRSLALSNTFAGGVLGGAGLIHLLGGALDGFGTVAPNVGYPVPLLLAGVGFLLVLLIEGVVVAGPAPHEAGSHAGESVLQHEFGRRVAADRRPYAMILLVVLSVHSVVMGLALGAQRARSGALLVLSTILVHKAVAGFALGVSYYKAGFARRRAAPYMAFFASTTPVGIVAGTLVGAGLSAHNGQGFQAVFDSLGAGTFLYIATLDIIRTEFDSFEDRWQKWVSTSMGFAAMALLAIWI